MMDSPWEQELWFPTHGPQLKLVIMATPSEFTTVSTEVQQFTHEINEQPYSPTAWFKRAQALQKLGYPDLWVGDAHKARLLVEAALAGDSDIGEKAWLEFWRGCEDGRLSDDIQDLVRTGLFGLEKEIWNLITEGLVCAQAWWDIIHLKDSITMRTDHTAEALSSVAEEYQKRRNLFEDGQDTSGHSRYGQLLMRPYPWMAQDVLRKGEHAFQRLQEDLEATSQSRCKLVRSTTEVQPLRSSTQWELENKGVMAQDVFGVVAAKDLRRGQTILIDQTITAITTFPERCEICHAPLRQTAVTLGCCDIEFCGQTCATKANEAYHKVICGKDIPPSALDEMKPASQASILLQLRILAMIVQADKDARSSGHRSHPLHHPAVNYLSTNYLGAAPVAWSYQDHIVLPTKMLQSYGIDVFADLRYDTWVLQTLNNRIANNIGWDPAGDGGSFGLHPRYTLFNHSCHPNVTNETLGRRAPLILKAGRDINEGEELFVSYSVDLKSMDYDERQKELASWFGGDCGCPRCKAERAGGAEEAAYRMQHATL